MSRRPLWILLVALVSSVCRTSNARLSDESGGEAFSHSLEIADRGRFFAAEAPGRPAWVKWMIKLDEPSIVYFQDSRAFPFHYDFAKAHLPGFGETARAEFDAVSLRLEGQRVLLGAVIVPPDPRVKEYGIQIVGQDAYDVDTVTQHVTTVRAAIRAPDGVPFRDFYLPTFEQRAAATAGAAALQERGIEVMEASRWLSSSVCYSGGWTVGRVTRVAADRIDKAFGDGTLRPDDVLLTDGIPAEIPPVAGVVTTAPATPNSHVALLAESFGIPFVFLALAPERQRIESLIGRTIGLEVRTSADLTGGCAVKMIDLSGKLPDDVIAKLSRLKAPAAVTVARVARAEQPLLDVAGLTDADLAKAGGKAVGFALLRAAVPESSPEAKVLTFDAWLDFMATPYGNGTLGEQIASRLAPFSTYPPDIAQVRAALKGVRKLVKDTPIPAALRTRIVQALRDAGFATDRKLRLRSSTNVEDTATFNGAGLYDSYSGCLADDLDEGDAGPSGCDAADPEEKGVVRALQKVFASFYNDNAFLERLRHHVAETDTGMAVLVHYSFPDGDEAANGVLTLSHFGGFESHKIVSQPGAASVTNPDAGASPEIAVGYAFGTEVSISFEQGSSRLPLGAHVLEGDGRYQELVALARRVAAKFMEIHPDRPQFKLDFEYKLVAPATLTLKQVREVPIRGQANPLVPYLTAGTTEFCVAQTEGAPQDVLANQRLKSRFKITTRATQLTRDAAGESFFAAVGEEGVALDGVLLRRDGADARDGFAYGGTQDGQSARAFATLESWRRGLASDVSAVLRMRAEFPGEVDGRQTLPIVLPSDLTLELRAAYSVPMATRTFEGWTTTDQDGIALEACRSTDAESGGTGLRREKTMSGGGITIRTAYWYPPAPQGFSAGYTAPLLRFEHTTISGLTTAPLELGSYFSQAFTPEHHNFTEHFVFQPAAEPGIPEAQRQELEAKDVRYVYANTDGDVWLLGRDGSARVP